MGWRPLNTVLVSPLILHSLALCNAFCHTSLSKGSCNLALIGWMPAHVTLPETGLNKHFRTRRSSDGRSCARVEGSVLAMMPKGGSNDNGRQAKAYLDILRPQNIPASFGLVATGALVSSHNAACLSDPKVLLTALAAALVSVGSCVLNDWFDLELDRVNKPDRPLVTGAVSPLHAVLMGGGCLLMALVSAAEVHPAALQATIVTSVGLTSLYTPVLKPIPLVKTIVVSLVITAAITSGGLAAGAGLFATMAPSLLTFFVIAHREIIMDISDVEGDAAAGIRTLPVLLGVQWALAFAVILLTVGVGSTLWYIFCSGAGVGAAGSAGAGGTGATGLAEPVAVVTGSLQASLDAGTGGMGGGGTVMEAGSAAGATVARPLMVAALTTAFSSPLYMNAFKIWQSNFNNEVVLGAVDSTLLPLALILGLLGIVLQ